MKLHETIKSGSFVTTAAVPSQINLKVIFVHCALLMHGTWRSTSVISPCMIPNMLTTSISLKRLTWTLSLQNSLGGGLTNSPQSPIICAALIFAAFCGIYVYGGTNSSKDVTPVTLWSIASASRDLSRWNECWQGADKSWWNSSQTQPALGESKILFDWKAIALHSCYICMPPQVHGTFNTISECAGIHSQPIIIHASPQSLVWYTLTRHTVRYTFHKILIHCMSVWLSVVLNLTHKSEKLEPEWSPPRLF